MHRAYKYRLYPTEQQKQLLDQTFGATRFVWNKLVENFNAYGNDSHVANLNEIAIKQEHSFLYNVNSYSLQQKRRDFEQTKTQYFNKKRKIQIGRMKFKKRGVSRDSFRIPAAQIGSYRAIDFDKGTIRLTNIGFVKARFDRTFSGKFLSVTISKTKTDEYYVSCLVEVEPTPLKPTGKDIGIDLGLIDLITTTDGTRESNPKFFCESQAELAKHQRHLSRKKKGSQRYKKQKKRVARIHQKVARQRAFVHHNITTEIVRNNDAIYVENLDITGMIKQNMKLSKSIYDASWGKFVRMLEYKSEFYGRYFHKIDRYYPSSKTCNVCGKIMPSMKLSQREWTCPNCKTKHDRDVNAAINILNKGRLDRQVLDLISEESPDYSRGGDGSPIDLKDAEIATHVVAVEEELSTKGSQMEAISSEDITA